MKLHSKRRRRRHHVRRVVVDAIANVHWHGREVGPVMKALIKWAVKGGADVLAAMPNTIKPLLTALLVAGYIAQARQLTPRKYRKQMTFKGIVMLTEDTTYAELEACKKAGIEDGKIYPYLRTTKSKHGIKNYGKMIRVVRWCGMLGINVHVHFEHPDPVYINRDAEYICLPICQVFLEETDAIIIWEHGTDARCIRAWKKMAKTGRFFVTLTAHHLVWDEDSAFGDVRKKCKPPIKTEPDRLALIRLVAEDHEWVMAGADDAAHDETAKHVHEGKCACGAFTSPFLILLYAHALTDLLRTKRGIRIFNNFISQNARKLHKLPPASRQITLEQAPFTIPPTYEVGPWIVEPPGVGEVLEWSFAV